MFNKFSLLKPISSLGSNIHMVGSDLLNGSPQYGMESPKAGINPLSIIMPINRRDVFNMKHL